MWIALQTREVWRNEVYIKFNSANIDELIANLSGVKTKVDCCHLENVILKPLWFMQILIHIPLYCCQVYDILA